MHAILIAIGSAGDVFPFIGLARTLKLRGHRVSLCTIPVFRDAVEQHGIAFVPLSDELTYRRTMGDPRLWDPKTSFGVLWQAIAGMIEPVYEYVSAQRHDDIVVVGSLWALGARIAHEKYGIPYLSAQVSPSTLLSAHLPPVHPKFNVPEQMPLAMRKLLWRCIERFKLDRTCAPEINAVRRKVGLETPVKRIFTQWMHSPQGVVCLFPAWFAPPQQDWPQPLHMTGFPLFDGSIPGTPLDDELQRFLDQGNRPLVFTQGSTEHLQGDFYAMALRAGTPRRAWDIPHRRRPGTAARLAEPRAAARLRATGSLAAIVRRAGPSGRYRRHEPGLGGGGAAGAAALRPRPVRQCRTAGPARLRDAPGRAVARAGVARGAVALARGPGHGGGLSAFHGIVTTAQYRLR